MKLSDKLFDLTLIRRTNFDLEINLHSLQTAKFEKMQKEADKLVQVSGERGEI